MTSLLGLDFGLSVPGETNATATGSTQADAYFLRQQMTVFGTVASGAGAILPGSYSANASVTVANRGANDLMLYPGEGDQIEGLSIDAPFTVAAGSQVQMVSFDPPMSRSPRTWWIMGLVSGIVHVIGGSIDGATIGASIPSTGAFTSLTSQSGALNGTIGATTPNTGAFTSVEFNTAAASRLWSYVSADTALEYTVAGTKMLRVLDGGLTMGKFFATDNSGQALGAGGYLNAYGSFSGALSGTKTAGTNALVSIVTSADTLAAGGGGLSGLRVDLTQGGTGAAGSRVGVFINQIHHGNLTAKSLGYGNQIGGLWSYVTIDGNFGGTAGNSNSYGSAWGGIASIQLNAGATYMTGISGLEVNMGVGTGASAVYVTGAAVVLGTHRQATSYLDSFLSVGATVDRSRVGLGNLIGLGSATGYWGLDATGDVMQLITSNATLAGGPLPYTARNGINLTGITFSGSPFLSTGFAVDPAGVLSASALATGGTTARTLAAIFGDVLNVKAFGAKGDGATDDQPAIAAALTAAAAGNVKAIYFPPSATAYMMGANITLSSGIALVAHPGTATIKATATNASSPVLFAAGSSGVNNVFVYGLTIDGNVSGQTGGGGAANGAILISIFKSTRVVFDHVKFQNSYGISLQFSTNISYSGARACSFDQIGMYGHTSGLKADYKQGVSLVDVLGGTSTDNFLEDCMFSNIGFDAVNVSYQNQLSIQRNRMYLNNQQWYGSGVGCAGVFIIGSNQVSVIGNLIDKASGAAYDLDGNDGLIFIGNEAHLSGVNGILIGNGIHYGVTTGTNNFIISSNAVFSSGQNLASHSSALIFTNAGSGGGPTTNGVISGNIFSDEQGTPTQEYGIATYDSGFGMPTLSGVLVAPNNSMTGNKLGALNGVDYQPMSTPALTAATMINTGARSDQSADVYVATAAGSRTIPNGCSWEALTPAATIATFATTMPAAPIDKQEVWISTTQTITTWTISANTGQTINGAPTTLAANTSVMFRYNLATTAWFRMV